MPDAEVQAMSSRIGRESSKVEVESLALMMRSTNEAISNVRVLLRTMKGMTTDDVAGTNDKGGITYDDVVNNIMSREKDEEEKENVVFAEPKEQPTRTISGEEEGPDVESIEGLVTSGVSSEFMDEKENANDKLISTRTEIGKEGLNVVCPKDDVTLSRESDDETENVVIADEPTGTRTESGKEVSDVEIKDEVVTSYVIAEIQDEKENVITVNEVLDVEIPEGVVTSNVSSGSESEDEKENVCIQSMPVSKPKLQPPIPSYTRLEPSVRDRIKAIDDVRILLEHEQGKGWSSSSNVFFFS